MNIGIDDMNRTIKNIGYKMIIDPRYFDFKDFPTSATPVTSAGVTYNHWLIKGTENGFNYKSLDNGMKFNLSGIPTVNGTSYNAVLMTTKNVKKMFLNFISRIYMYTKYTSTYSGSAKLELVTPDGSVLQTIFSGTATINTSLSFAMRWKGNICDIVYTTSSSTYTITNPDVRLRLTIVSTCLNNAYSASNNINIVSTFLG